MQNINSKVQHFLKKHKRKHIYMAVAASLSLIVMLTVSMWLIKPGISATKLSDSSYIDDVEMLVGTNSSIKGSTVSETIRNANDMYLLGIASQFSVFLEEDFKITAADTEGRLACGGNLNTAGYLFGSQGGDGYRIGLGHYLDSYTSINLVDELYGGTYAHAIVGGNITAKLATNPSIFEIDGKAGTRWRTVLINSEKNLDASYATATSPGMLPGFPGPGSMGVRATGYLNSFYTKTSEVLDFQSAFELLKQRSNTIAAFASLTENTVAVNVDAQTVTFTGPGADKIADSIVFNITAEQWSQISAMTNPVFMYEDIPQLSTPATGIEVRGKEDISTSTTVDAKVVDVTWENSYIIVNVEGHGNLQMPQTAVSTSVNGYWINKAGKNDDDVNANLNNKFGCSTILYNFSDATGLKLGGDFQGTVLAPLADVTDMSTGTKEDCKGHLSGTLIAKSFDGATQFGYRTNLTAIDMLTISAQYEVNVDKFDGENKFLSGATLGLYTVDDNGELSAEPVYSWTSGLSSETIIVEPDVRYAIKEMVAPDGYEITEKTYYFIITEAEQQYATATVDTGEILGFFYVPTVDITVYGDSSFNSKTVTVTYSTTDLKQTGYMVDDSVYSGTDLPASVYVDDYNGNKFVSKDGVLLTPIVNLNQDITVDDEDNFTFVNKLKETPMSTPILTPSLSTTSVAGVADVIGEINIDKLDGDNNNSGLSGAAIQLYRIENGSETLVQEYITDGNTKTLSGIEPGDYKLLESSAPKGYELSDTVYYFRVTKGEQQTASLSLDNGLESVTIDLNYVPSISITVYKDSGFSNIIATAMYSATYPDNVSFNIDGKVYSGTDLPDSVSKVDYNGCMFVVKGEEVITPIINLNKSVWINGNNTFVFINTKGIKGADITLRKVDVDDGTETALSNACIELYDADSNVNIAKYTLGISSVTNGLDVDYILDGGLKPGNYYFKETRVPDGGYLLPEDNTFEFTVNKDGTITEGSDYLKYSTQYVDTLLILNKKGIYVEKVWKKASGNVTDAPVGSEITVNIYKSPATEVYSSMRMSLDGDDSGHGTDTSYYTIENILSKYQIFVEDDFYTSNHMVGAIAAGGNMYANSWGDAQIAPSVIGGEFQGVNFNNSQWISDEQKQLLSSDYNKVFYNTTSVNVSTNGNLVQNSDYLDFESVMSSVRSESSALTEGAVEITETNSTLVEYQYGNVKKMRTIDLSQLGSKNIVIPYEIFSQSGAINFTGVTLDEFATGGYTISIIGVNDAEVVMDFTDYIQSGGTRILFDGKGIINDSSLKKKLEGGLYDGQLNLVAGMNLVFNLPDATNTITVHYLSGHLVAPNAHVFAAGNDTTVNGQGNFEGSIIAKSAKTNSQGHFYPYNPIESVDIKDEISDSETESELIESFPLSSENNWKKEILIPDVEDYNNGNYYIEEVAVPGYKTEVAEEAVQQDDGTYVIVITNTQHMYEMPSAGGGGTKSLVTAGAMILSVACIGLVAKRRKTLAKINKTH